MRVAIRGSTGLPQGRTEGLLSPSETGLFETAPSRVPKEAATTPKSKARVSAAAQSETKGILGVVADFVYAKAYAEAETAPGVNGKGARVQRGPLPEGGPHPLGRPGDPRPAG